MAYARGPAETAGTTARVVRVARVLKFIALWGVSVVVVVPAVVRGKDGLKQQ